MANKTITQLDAAQSLNDNMVIAVQDTNTTYKTTLADVKAYCGGSGGDAYKVGDRVNDDSDNPVGTVSSIFTDGNGDRYAVVCLDAVNRLASGSYLSSNQEVTNIPSYGGQTLWSAPETATTNTDAILATGTSSACTHCRSKSFIIDNTTYYGQLPNIKELTDILANRIMIDDNDPTASSYSSLVISQEGNTWSSNQCNSSQSWEVAYTGAVTNNSKTLACKIIPVLEIPLED